MAEFAILKAFEGVRKIVWTDRPTSGSIRFDPTDGPSDGRALSSLVSLYVKIEALASKCEQSMKIVVLVYFHQKSQESPSE